MEPIRGPRPSPKLAPEEPFTATSIGTRLAEVRAGTLGIEDFQDWFVANSWNVHHLNNRRLEHIVGGIELCFVEFSVGDMDEMELLEECEKVLKEK